MRYSQLFGKTKREAPKDEVAVNAKLLLRGGFIDKLMAGSYTLLPLGKSVEAKIQEIVRKGMNATGAQEILMPLLHPKEIWNETGRWDSAREVMYQFKKDNKEYALSFTHEEIVLDLIRKHASSYKDYPIKIYHFSTKFRDEPRARSGILRGREFLMKDLYSAHTTEEDMNKYYWEVAEAYKKIFKRIGFEVKVTESGGGVFTEENTHEFQVLNEGGEDTIFYCDNCEFAQNKEIAEVREGNACTNCKEGKIQMGKSIEVGNIFRFWTSYSEKMSVTLTGEKGEKRYPYFASYGIGVTRLIGTLVELFHDERGIIWPKEVAPYECHLVAVSNEQNAISNKTDDVYEMLNKAGVEVLYDDRKDVSAGEKFADADLVGVPVRLVVSEQTGDKVEWKKRDSDKAELISLEEAIERLKE
ncbi:hypothetical protein HYV21_01920 [Candidatus Microgenomates bacterium]|nr:hypothetical protein [Candidatus Microgenomates bacterium]